MVNAIRAAVMFCTLVCSMSNAYARSLESIERIKSSIVTTLTHHQSAPQDTVNKFHDFFKRYDSLIVSFFDTHNYDPLAQHVSQMENELSVLKTVCDNPQFTCVKTLLSTYYDHACQLVGVLKKHIGSHNTWSLALEVRKYKFLLPESIKQKGDWSLFWALQHRLNCDRL